MSRPVDKVIMTNTWNQPELRHVLDHEHEFLMLVSRPNIIVWKTRKRGG